MGKKNATRHTVKDGGPTYGSPERVGGNREERRAAERAEQKKPTKQLRKERRKKRK